MFLEIDCFQILSSSHLVDQLYHGGSQNLEIEPEIISQVVQWCLPDTLLNEKLVNSEVGPQEVSPMDLFVVPSVFLDHFHR